MSMVTTQEINELLTALNSYDETHPDPRDSNIWQDVILAHPLYSESATDVVDQDRSDRFALVDGTMFEYEPMRTRWVAS